MRYLEYILLRRSLDHAKRSFYRAANSIFSKIGRIASEEIVLQLIKSKCIYIYIFNVSPFYCTAWKHVNSQIASLDFVIAFYEAF